MRSRSSLVMECERCGQPHTIERAGRFRDADYHELLHDYFALEVELRQTRARLELALTKASDREACLQMLADNFAAIARYWERIAAAPF